MKLNEYQEQILTCDYLDILINQGKVVMYTAVNPRPNMEHVGQRMKAKRAGLHAGFPDLIIVTPKKVFCIEMKTKGNKLRKEQEEWHVALEKAGVTCSTAWGFLEAKEIIDNETKNA